MQKFRCHAQLLGAAAMVVGFAACASDSNLIADPPALPYDQVVGSVTLSPRNAIVAVGGAVDIQAVASDLSGNTITAPDSVTYQLVSVSDTIRMRVTKKNVDTYTIVGRAKSFGPMQVNVFVYKNNTVQADQAFIHVTDTVPTGPLSLQLGSSAGTSLLIRGQSTMSATLRNGAGAAVMTPKVRYYPKGVDSAKISTYRPGIRAPGDNGITLSGEWTYFFGENSNVVAKVGDDSAYVYADVNAYGTVVRDSLLFHLSYPSTGTIGPFALPDGYEIIDISAHVDRIYKAPATLTFTYTVFMDTPDPLPLDYVFDQPDKALATTPGGASGNIIGLNAFGRQQRLFTTPGHYRFTATIGGNTPPYSGQSWSLDFTIK